MREIQSAQVGRDYGVVEDITVLVGSVIIYQVHVLDLVFREIDEKRQTAVSGNAQAPCSFLVARERRMRAESAP